jgi:hypothetical protein
VFAELLVPELEEFVGAGFVLVDGEFHSCPGKSLFDETGLGRWFHLGGQFVEGGAGLPFIVTDDGFIGWLFAGFVMGKADHLIVDGLEGGDMD